MILRFAYLLPGVLVAAGCGGGSGAGPDASNEGGLPSTAHCEYEELPATAGAGGTVTPGQIQVGVADNPLGLPVGAALGGNTSRAVVIGNQGAVDNRKVPLSGAFTPSVGIETIPRAKAVAITAGGERVVIIRTDTIFSDDTITHEVARRLGSDYAGKVIWASSHTHTAPEQYTADSKLQVGGGRKRRVVRDGLIEVITRTAQEAIADLQPARIGIAAVQDFDPDDLVSYDRRDENDDLFGGSRQKDQYLAVVRIDSPAGEPRAVLPVFGVHSAILDDDVSMFSTDVSGMYERFIEEQFDREVVAIHLQGAAGDVLARSRRHINHPDDDNKMDFAMSEFNARRFMPQFLPVYEAAGNNMVSELAMEMLTRSVELGPDWRTFTVRDGALEYAPFDGEREADRELYDGTGAVRSPIDEFNAPVGAGLCGDPGDDIFQGARMPNVTDLGVYHSCAQIAEAVLVLGALIDSPFEDAPLCSSTRTTVSALRLGDWLFATAPGEPLVLWADTVRARSPADPDRTVILGYAQGHIGYLLTAEDWLIGGFEPSINIWGPLEGEYIAERLLEVMALAVTDSREDAVEGGTTRLSEPVIDDSDLTGGPDPAPMAGTVPDAVPPTVWLRSDATPTAAQPDGQIPRVSGMARFVWIGEDPLSGTPRITLQRDTGAGFADVTRRSGRVVGDYDLLLTHTPDPLRPGGSPRTHYWAVEWQAVAWLGSTAEGVTDDVEDRAGVPTGTYRFHVEGTGYTVDSRPFEVIDGSLTVTAAVDGTNLAITAGYNTARGNWRLLTMDGLSNELVPVRRGPVTVELSFQSGGSARLTDVAITAEGGATVAVPGGEVVTGVTVIDRYGNRGSGAP